jgi:hypothetical protein
MLPDNWSAQVEAYKEDLDIRFTAERAVAIELLPVAQFQRVFDYIDRQWYPYRERYASAWIDKYRHFGVTTTSRVEGAHAAAKAGLTTSKGNLYTVHLVLTRTTRSQRDKYEQKLNTERSILHDKFRKDILFCKLNKHISLHALELINEQKVLVEVRRKTGSIRFLLEESCTGNFEQCMGLPCSHTLEKIIYGANNRKYLELSDIDPHWWLNDGKEPAGDDGDNSAEAEASESSSSASHPEVHEPARVQGKGRPTGSTKLRKGFIIPPSNYAPQVIDDDDDDSTTRYPSAFERQFPSTAPARTTTISKRKKAQESVGDGRRFEEVFGRGDGREETLYEID